jgi:hypothetical protein
MPPAITVDGTQGREETYWVDKDTGIPLKLYSKGWALDGSFGWEGEGVLVNTNVDLGAESTQPASPTYTLTVPSTPGFPETGKFWSWYVLENGWNMRDASNVSYYQEGYQEGLLTRWVADITNDEALVYKIFWGDYLCDEEGVKELEAVDILYTVYRANTTTREILEAISSLIYHVNMTSLTYEIIDRTAMLAGDVGEETYCWLPTDIHIGAKVNITWSYDRPWTLDNATYSVIDDKILSALDEPQACWVLYLPPTTSIDGTWNYSETWYSDKDVGIPLCSLSKGWAVDGSSGYVDNCWLIDTNVDLGPNTYYLTITSTEGGTTNPLPGTYSYTVGSSLNVTATPDPGYSFDYWLLDGEERTENPITMTMDANRTLEAVFVDALAPEICIISPENKTYPIKDVPLTFTVSESTSWIGYSLNNQANVTIPGNTTLTSLLDGVCYVVIYANDTTGNMGASSTVYFTVDTTHPNITNVIQNPPKNNVLPEDEVKINATVTDALSEVKRVTLIYAYSNSSGTWIRIINMTNIDGNIWNATIPAFPYCTNVTYIIMAEDKAGNTITTIEMGFEYQYSVIPEFPTAIIMPLFMIATLLTVIVYRRKQE